MYNKMMNKLQLCHLPVSYLGNVFRVHEGTGFLCQYSRDTENLHVAVDKAVFLSVHVSYVSVDSTGGDVSPEHELLGLQHQTPPNHSAKLGTSERNF